MGRRGDIIAQQASSTLKKDVIAPRFGEWNESANPAWQSVFLNKATPEAAMRAMAAKWNKYAKANAHVSTVRVSALDRLGRRRSRL